MLDDTITQAKRASAILERMRRWTKPRRQGKTQSSLTQAADVVEGLLGPDAKRQNTTLVVKRDKNHDQTMIHADAVELEQVIFNLVRNALDAVQSVQDPTIKIETLLEDDRISLTVADNGIGLPDTLKDRLFEPFVTDKPEGTGLGLALCQRLVERMDGDISAAQLDGWTIFTAKFPATDAELQVAAQ
ncbi:MAG: ATP-binding protein [Lentilitoribacter sp.]